MVPANMNSININNGFIANGTTQSVTSTINGTPVTYTGADATLAADVEKIAEGAASKILSTFTSLNSAASTNLIGLNLGNIDGVNNTLASASLSMSYGTNASGSDFTNMGYTLNVDTSDFPASSYDKADLASTLAHEMMHMVMYDTVTSGMTGDNKYSQWLIEGMAQVAGGGMTAGHNANIESMSNSQMSAYLSNFKSDVYGAGYLATMYLGAAVNAGAAGSTVTSFTEADTKDGLNKLLGELVAGKTLDEAIKENTQYDGLLDFESSLSTDAVQFSKSLATTVANANGSGSLLVGVTNDSTNLYTSVTGASMSKYDIVTTTSSVINNYGAKFDPSIGGIGISLATAGALHLQIGANMGQSISYNRYDVSSDALGLGSISVSSHESASSAINSFDAAIQGVSNVRSYYGAIQNRLEHAKTSLDNTSENLQSAESRIRDVDMAKEMMNYSKNNILQQAAMNMLAQANQSPQSILSILQ